MQCPYCTGRTTRVVDKRDSKEGVIRRRRECLKCHKRFTTYEKVELIDLYVVKKDRRREQFDAQKLTRGILKACEKRPISKMKIEKIVHEIELKLRKANKSEIKSTRIGEMVSVRLKKIDKVAYIRFASVYRSFSDIQAFIEELKKIEVETKKKKK